MSAPINLNKKTFRPDEVAQILSLTRRTVYRMLHDGRLPGVRFGGGPWRILRETLIPFLSPGQATGTPTISCHRAFPGSSIPPKKKTGPDLVTV